MEIQKHRINSALADLNTVHDNLSEALHVIDAPEGFDEALQDVLDNLDEVFTPMVKKLLELLP